MAASMRSPKSVSRWKGAYGINFLRVYASAPADRQIVGARNDGQSILETTRITPINYGELVASGCRGKENGDEGREKSPKAELFVAQTRRLVGGDTSFCFCHDFYTRDCGKEIRALRNYFATSEQNSPYCEQRAQALLLLQGKRANVNDAL